MEKVYLKFNRFKCDRKKEIETLVNFFDVEKMPAINDFIKINEENSSIYQIILKEGGDYEKLNEYFYKNPAVVKLSEKDLNKFYTEEYYVCTQPLNLRKK